MYKISYTGDDTITSFAFSFPFFQPLDVCVAINEVILADTEYNLLSNEDLTGGTISFITAPAIGEQIDIFRKIRLTRFIDYQPTAKIDPENLNADFNFLLEAFKDLNAIDINLTEWQNIHDNVLSQINLIKDLIEDKTGTGAVLGLYNNLLNVLSTILPRMINDYGDTSSAAESIDDYGTI